MCFVEIINMIVADTYNARGIKLNWKNPVIGWAPDQCPLRFAPMSCGYRGGRIGSSGASESFNILR